MTPPRMNLPEDLCICRDPECRILYGYCHCRCGKKTIVATMSSTRRGTVKGRPAKYAQGHATRYLCRRPEAHPKVNQHYVYAYIRSKSSPNGAAGTPFYIGKGQKKRAWSRTGRSIRRPHVDFIKIISDNMSCVDALQLEILLIYQYGRLDIGTGCLRNKTSGGDGARHPSEITKKKQSDYLSEKWRNPSSRPKMLRSLKGKNLGRKHSPETIEKFRQVRRGIPKGPMSEETKAKLSASKLGKPRTSAVRIPKHGTTWEYHLGCRCEECRSALSQYRQTYKKVDRDKSEV